jgi:hypothetical protein
MLGRLAALRMLRLLRVWVACAALSLLPAPSAPVLASDVVTVQAYGAAHEEEAPSDAATVLSAAAPAPRAYVAARTPTRLPARAVAHAPRGALYLRHCSLLL